MIEDCSLTGMVLFHWFETKPAQQCGGLFCCLRDGGDLVVLATPPDHLAT